MMIIKITSNDVPSYLRDGSLFETLDIADTEQFEIPADCYKQDTTVQTPSDLRFLIRSLRFWAVDDLPVNVIFFLITNDDSELTKICAEFPEYDRWWKMIAKFKTYPSEETIEGAIKVGFPLTVLRELQVRGDFALTAKACVAAAALSTVESVEILTYLHQQGCPWDTNTTDAAARAGNLPCLIYAHKNGCGLSADCLETSAFVGQLESIKYLRSVGVPILPETIDSAVWSHKREVIQYLCESGCALTSVMCLDFAIFGSLECLKYAHESGCAWDSKVCSYSAAFGRLHCLEYAHQNGCPWDHNTTNVAAHNGNLECLKYAHSRGCPMSNAVMDLSIRAGSWKCFCYTLKHRYISSDLVMIIHMSMILAIAACYGTWTILIHPGAAYVLIECTLNLFGPLMLSERTIKIMRSMNQTICVGMAAVVCYQLYTGGDLGL